MLSIL